MPLQSLKPITQTWAAIEEIKKEIAPLLEAAAKEKTNIWFRVYVDINGDVHKCGDFPGLAPGQRYKTPEHCELAYSAEVDRWQDWEPWKRTYFENRYALQNWITKSRDKIHHINLPMRRRVHLGKETIIKQLELVDGLLARDALPKKSETDQALNAIREVMATLRKVERELKMQINQDLIARKG
jgi:hypothetical protein